MSGSLKDFLFFYIFPSYQQVSIPYILLACSDLHNIFYGMSLLSQFYLYLSYKL